MAGEVFQFKIVLQGTKPPIWRRIQILEECSFWDLHVAIQDAMGWKDCHLHIFSLPCGDVGIPDDCGFDDVETKAGWQTSVKENMKVGDSVHYIYDFGDGWTHKVTLEKVLKPDPALTYPVCVTGKRACPPEDCGGPYGYGDLLDILSDAKHPEHEEMLDWMGDEFDSESFSPDKVHFWDPAERLKFRQM